MTIYFSDKINFETYIGSWLNIKEFTDEISKKFNVKDSTFINFIGYDTKFSINKNNVLFYTIERVDEE